MLEWRNIKKPELDAEMVGVAALTFLAGDPDLLRRFLDLSGLTVEQLRAEASKPAFFVGVLDFILAHEPTVMAFAEHADLSPEAIGRARESLAGSRAASSEAVGRFNPSAGSPRPR